MRIITAQNVMNSVGVCLSLQRINPPLRQALLVFLQANRINIPNQLLSCHQLLIQRPLLLFLLTKTTTTSFMSLDSDSASLCLNCSQLYSFLAISFSSSVFSFEMSSSLRPFALGSSSFRNTRMSEFSSNLTQRRKRKEINLS